MMSHQSKMAAEIKNGGQNYTDVALSTRALGRIVLVLAVVGCGLWKAGCCTC